jgi:protein-S-isoprenylcysteine O-methyltransferase Ste14
VAASAGRRDDPLKIPRMHAVTLAERFAANRIRMSQLFGLLIVTVLAVSESRWEYSVLDAVLFLLGAVLVGGATMGRLWCSLYIAGYKEGTLVTTGPYSISRNPLYFFSLVGAIGLGFATETLTFAAVFALWFAWLYPGVIRAEERRLRELHGAAFDEYARRVPRFVPRLRLLVEPQSYTVQPVRFRNHLLDALWLVWGLGLLELIEAAHKYELLPTLVRWY